MEKKLWPLPFHVLIRISHYLGVFYKNTVKPRKWDCPRFMKSFFAAGQPRGTKPPSWHKTNKELTSFPFVSSNSVSFVSAAWYFCTKWLTNCKKPIWKWREKLGFHIRNWLSDFVIGQKNLVIITRRSWERVDLKAGFYFTLLRIRHECWQQLTSFQGKSPGEEAALNV